MIRIHLKKIGGHTRSDVKLQLKYWIVINHQWKSVHRGFIEKLGFYIPYCDKWKNKYIYVNMDRVNYWVKKGIFFNSLIWKLLQNKLYYLFKF